MQLFLWWMNWSMIRWKLNPWKSFQFKSSVRESIFKGSSSTKHSRYGFYVLSVWSRGQEAYTFKPTSTLLYASCPQEQSDEYIEAMTGMLGHKHYYYSFKYVDYTILFRISPSNVPKQNSIHQSISDRLSTECEADALPPSRHGWIILTVSTVWNTGETGDMNMQF